MLESPVLKGCPREVVAVVTSRSPLRLVRVWAFVVLIMLQAGCAATPRPASEAAAPAPVELAPAPAPPSEPILNLTELDALEHDLSVSEARLDEEFGREAVASDESEASASEPTEPQKSADSAGSAAVGGSARPRRKPAAEPSDRAANGPESSKLGSRCDLGCRALASMQRAQLKICEIVGPNERCQRATERVQAAVERVRAAGCECRAEDR
jgi:hypothetical protein